MKKIAEVLNKVGTKSATMFLDNPEIPMPSPCWPLDSYQPALPSKIAEELNK